MNNQTEKQEAPATPETENTKTLKIKEVVLLIMATAAITITACVGFYTVKLSEIKKGHQTEVQSTITQLEDLNTEIAQLRAGIEPQLEQIHGIAVDQGYQAAIWDVYFGTPHYLVQEDEKGVSLWKKQEIDPSTIQRINRETEEGTKPESTENEE